MYTHTCRIKCTYIWHAIWWLNLGGCRKPTHTHTQTAQKTIGRHQAKSRQRSARANQRRRRSKRVWGDTRMAPVHFVLKWLRVSETVRAFAMRTFVHVDHNTRRTQQKKKHTHSDLNCSPQSRVVAMYTYIASIVYILQQPTRKTRISRTKLIFALLSAALIIIVGGGHYHRVCARQDDGRVFEYVYIYS